MKLTGPDGCWKFVAILLLAAGARIAACALWSDDLNADPDAYRDLAGRMAEGQGYVSPGGNPTAFRPPLYPTLLAAVLWAGPVGIAAVHILLGTATVALTAALGRRLGLGRLSLFAALLVAVDPLLLRYTPRVMTEVTCAFLAVLVLWIAATGRRPFWLGLAFGLALLSRPTFGVFGAFAAALWVLRRLLAWRRGTDGVDRRFLLLVAAGLLAVVAPWGIRNAIQLGRPILTTTHGGYTLLLANNRVFWKEVVAGPDEAWQGASLDAWQRSLETEMTERGLTTEIDRDAYLRQKAVAEIRKRPDFFLRGALYRMGRFWSFMPTGPEAASTSPTLRGTVGAFYLIVSALALVGIARLAVSAWRAVRNEPHDSRAARSTVAWTPLLLLVLAFMAVHAVYWTDTRMRAPLVPAIALLAARGTLPLDRRD